MVAVEASSDVITGGTDMSDETQGTSTPESNDEIKNIKSEFQRKTQNLAQEMEQLKQANQQLLQTLAQVKQSAAPAPKEEKPLSDLMYSDPDRFLKIFADEVKKSVREEQTQAVASQQQVAKVISSITAEYPEMKDESSPLYQRAVEIYNELDDGERASPMAYEKAALIAASELQVKPRSKRTEQDEEFIMSSMQRARPQSTKKAKLDSKVAAIAELMGLDINDQKVKDNLVKHQSRNFGQWKGIK